MELSSSGRHRAAPFFIVLRYAVEPRSPRLDPNSLDASFLLLLSMIPQGNCASVVAHPHFGNIVLCAGGGDVCILDVIKGAPVFEYRDQNATFEDVVWLSHGFSFAVSDDFGRIVFFGATGEICLRFRLLAVL